MTLRKLIERELLSYRAARAINDRDEAWHALERVHILSQRKFWLHIRCHVLMLAYAVALWQHREIFGQLLRLALAPFGNITGRLPIGNTGRANVSAFKPMDIPHDLKSWLEGDNE